MMKRLIFTIFLCFMITYAFAGPVQVRVESQPVIVGKPFTVTFRIQDPSQRMTPDFSPLEKHFNILSTATSTRISIINGQRQAEIVWSVIMQAKRAGKTTIPAIEFGSLRSDKTTVDVQKSASASASTVNKADKVDNQQSPVYLEASVDNKHPFINEAIIYKVSLYRQRGVFINGTYQQPDVSNAILVPLGKAQENKMLRDGRSFLVETMTYAIYANDKGKLNIQPPSLQGTISDVYMRRFGIEANNVPIDVRPIPKSAQNYWLPAEDVQLAQNFDQHQGNFKQGDTVVRTIQLSAVGLPAQLIPEFKVPASDKVKVYEEKPERNNSAANNQITGILTLKVTYLLRQAGAFSLPELKVRWFNTRTRQYQTARLPEMPLVVAPSKYSDASANQPQSKRPANPDTGQKAVKSTLDGQNSQPVLFWLLISAGILMCLGLVFFIQRRQLTQIKENIEPEPLLNIRQLKRQLKQVCEQNNAVEVRQLLIRWAKVHFDDNTIMNLSQVNQRVGYVHLNKAIQELNLCLYSPHYSGQWSGQALWQAWLDYMNKKKNPNKQHNALSPIFPET